MLRKIEKSKKKEVPLEKRVSKALQGIKIEDERVKSSLLNFNNYYNR
jgi:hypothetical protein